ncbi:MAG: DUF4397 domain-containing protein [Gemmatimonadales bacterium]
MRINHAATCAAVLAAACSGTATIPTGGTSGQVLLLNALATATSATLRLDGSAVALPPAGAATTLAVADGSHHIEALGPGNQVLAAADLQMSADDHRTAVLASSAGSVSLLVSALDTAQAPLTDAIKARMVHTVPNAPAMDAYLFLTSEAADSGTRIVSPFTYGTGTDPEFPGYAVRPPGEYLVWLKAAGTDNVLVQAGPVTLTAGHVYSFVLALNDAGEMELRTVTEQ